MILRRATFTTLLFLATLATFAQNSIHFKQINSVQGLSSNSVYAILKDSRGFMWFGTSFGLNRYDGYRVKKYFTTKNPRSLPENEIDDIQEDKSGNLWIKTLNSFAIYDYQKDCFYRNVPKYLLSIGFPSIRQIQFFFIDKSKNLWIYDGHTIYYYCFKEKRLRKYRQLGGKALATGRINSMIQMGPLYYFAHQSGLIEGLAPISNKIILRNYYLTRLTSHSEGFNMHPDNDKCIWLYSGFPCGAWRYDTKSGKWNHFDKDAPIEYRLSSNIVHKAIDDGKGNVWLATDHGGINIYNKHTNKVTYLYNDPTDPTTLGGNTLYTLYIDNGSIIWAGTFKKGVSYFSANAQKFTPYHLFNKNSSNSPNDINAICEDKNKNIWFGADGEGLVKLNRETNEMTFFKANGSSNSLSGNIIVSMMCDSKNRIWICTYLNGLCCYHDGKFTQYKHDPKNPNSLANNNIWDAVEDHYGNIWIGTLGLGVQMLNPQTGKFTTYNIRNGLSDIAISDICDNKKGKMFIGTTMGISEINIESFDINHLFPNNPIWGNLNVTCLYYDSRGWLWVGSSQGLSVYDEKRKKMSVINISKDMHGEIIKDIIEDDNKNMWVTTSEGLNNIIVDMNPTNHTFHYNILYYDESDGLQSTFFNGRSFCKAYDGKIFVGGAEGYNIIDPNNISYNHFQPKAVFTGLNIYNRSIDVDSTYYGDILLKHSLDQTQQIDLKYSEKMFSIEFSSLDYAVPSKSLYAYQLEGFNSNWIYTKENKVSFTNLDPGKYTLLVKAANSDGYWNNTPSVMTIVVHPPFWKTWKAYILYTLLILFGIFRYLKINKEKQEEKLRIQRIKMESKRQVEVNEMKLRFFTNISHDFRTPLALIITPLEKLIDEQSGNIKEQLTLIHKSAEQLLMLVNQLLDFRRLDVNKERLNLSEGNLIDVLKDICKSFEAYVNQKHIKLVFTSDSDELEMTFDKDKIEKIMMNLLSNAFKFTHEHGEIDVIESHNDNNVQIQVKDNGINIDDKDKEHIFERFYQVTQPKLNVGSGIGLHIVKEYIKLHGGQVTLTDNKPQGAIFTITLPIHKPDTLEDEEYDKQIADEINVNKDNRTPSILVVEDNENFKQFIMSCLKDDYSVYGADNGKDALEMLAQHEISVILSDIMMPVMDGLELCKHVKANINYSHIPVILLTARTTDEHKMEGLEYGADDYLTKPFNLKILKLRIKKFIEWNNRAHEAFRKKIDIKPSEITINSLDEKLMQKAMQKVEENISDPNFSVEELSEEVGMSRGHLYKKLISLTGKSPIEFIRIIRLKRSLQYLKESQMNVAEIAYEVGFNSPKIFSKYFKEEFGMTPSEYIKNNTNT